MMQDLILFGLSANTRLAFPSMFDAWGMPDSCLNNQFRAVGRAFN